MVETSFGVCNLVFMKVYDTSKLYILIFEMEFSCSALHLSILRFSRFCMHS